MRASGILLPVSSLPSKYGIGCFSESAYQFIDQLKAAGQHYWQILPLGPTSFGDSPYQSFSTVRVALQNGDWDTLKTLVPSTTLDYFTSPEAAPVLERIRRAGNVVHY